MSWFRWKGKQEPWGPQFSVVTVKLPDTGIAEAKCYSVPFDQHLQLIGVKAQINPGILPGGMFMYVYARRGGQILHLSVASHPSNMVGISNCWGGVGLARFLDRNIAHWGTWPIVDYFYLYPHDDVILDYTESAASNPTLLSCSFTFKQWITS